MCEVPYDAAAFGGASQRKKKRRGVPWDTNEVHDVWNMVHRTPAFASQIQRMQAQTMCKPFTLHIDGIPCQLQDAMQYLAETDWMDTVKDIFSWKLCFGIVPYYEKAITGTAHRIPKVPIYNSGVLHTYEKDDHTQSFEWHWYNDKYPTGVTKDTIIYWLRTGREPMLNGKLRSMAVSCLDLYDAVQKTQEDALYASYHRSHPMVVYEDAPPKANRDEKYEHTQFDMYGEDMVQQFMNEQEQRDSSRIRTLRADEVEDSLIRARVITDTRARNRPRQPTLQCKGIEHDVEREIFVHNHVTLPEDRKLAGRVEPAILWDPIKVRQELAIQAAEIVGVPLELTQSQSKVHASNHAGMMQSMGEVLKEHINWLNVALSRMYRNIYGETIVKGWNLMRVNGDYRLYPRKHFRSDDARICYEMEMARKVNIDIHLQCDPRVNASTILTLFSQNFMTKESAVDQLSRITGLSKGILQALPDPKEIKEKRMDNDKDNDKDKDGDEDSVKETQSPKSVKKRK